MKTELPGKSKYYVNTGKGGSQSWAEMRARDGQRRGWGLDQQLREERIGAGTGCLHGAELTWFMQLNGT